MKSAGSHTALFYFAGWLFGGIVRLESQCIWMQSYLGIRDMPSP